MVPGACGAGGRAPKRPDAVLALAGAAGTGQAQANRASWPIDRRR